MEKTKGSAGGLHLMAAPTLRGTFASFDAVLVRPRFQVCRGLSASNHLLKG